MHYRRLWWYGLLVFITISLITWQVLTPVVSTQAQVIPPANPSIVPAKWLGYQQKQSVTIHPDANSACKGYESEFESYGTYYTRKFIEPPKLFYKGDGNPETNEVAGAFCLIRRSPEGDEYELPVDVDCPFTGDIYNTYVYTGGTHGVCRLSSQKTNKLLSKETKDELNKLALQLYRVSYAAVAASPICGIATIYIVPCAAIFTSFSAGIGLIAVDLQEVAADPPDSNYKVIYQPVFPSLPDLQVQDGLTQVTVDAFNTLTKNLFQAIGFADAVYISHNRASTAIDAGETIWKQKQLEAAKQYMQQLGNLLDAEPTLLSNLVNTLHINGFPTITVGANDASNLLASVTSNGLPDSLVQKLKQLNADSNTIEQIRQFFIVQDINAIQGSYPQKLANQPLFDALHQTAKKLKDNPYTPAIANSL